MNSHMSPCINISDIGALLSRAGFVLITVDNEIIEIPYPNMFVLMQHLHGMGDQHAPNESVARYQGVSRDVFIAAAAVYDAMYSDSETITKDTREELSEQSMEEQSIDASLQIIYFMSWTPAPTQRKAMERGTAAYSMKDLETITDIIEEEDPDVDPDDGDDNVN